MNFLFPPTDFWREVKRSNQQARVLADRHYSRQTVGAYEFMPNGETFVLLKWGEDAVWGVCLNKDMAGNFRLRNTIFRNESQILSSLLISEATSHTRNRWPVPPCALTTEIDADRVKHKRDPGRCFIKAGWKRVGFTTKGLHLLEAPRWF